MKLFIVFISFFLAANQGLKTEEPEMTVTTDQLLDMLKNKSVKLIDVRNPWEIENEGKISGSVNIPLNELESALSMSENDFSAKYNMQMPKKDNCNLVFHCKSGGRSLKAVTMARNMGWHCSRHLLGGFDAWKKLGQEIEKTS